MVLEGAAEAGDNALSTSYLQSRGSDEEREFLKPPCGFGEGKMKKWGGGVELESQNALDTGMGGSTPVHQGGKLKREVREDSHSGSCADRLPFPNGHKPWRSRGGKHTRYVITAGIKTSQIRMV
jgi:hypothetical protein